jgi:PAS domain S-box-containing protein
MAGMLNLKLFHKGLVLITVPLLFELSFVACLSAMLGYAEAVAEREGKAKLIAIKAERLDQLIFQSLTALIEYAASGNESFGDRYGRSLAQISEEKANLVAAVTGNQAQADLVSSVVPLIDHALKLMNEAKRTIDESEGDPSLGYVQELRSEIQSVLAQIYPKLNAVAEAERKIVQSTPDQMLKFNNMIHTFLLFAVVFNIFLSIALVSYFNRDLVQRLGVMVDNARRIITKEELRSRLAGKDEIAHVDHVFHDMAEALAEAARKEKQAMEVIKSSETRLRSMLDNMPVGLIVCDEQGQIDFLNSRLESLLGFTQEDLAGKHLASLFPINTRKVTSQFVEDLRQRASGRLMEVEVGSKQGTILPVEISLSELKINDQNCLLISFADITERHELERLKRDVVAMVSHDLKTPLMSMQVSLAMVTEGRAGEVSQNARNMIQSCESSVERLISLIKRLLDAEKIKSGKMELCLKPVPLSAILETSIESVFGFAGMNNVTIESKVEECELLADGERLVQVVVNLLSNAVKFSPPGGVVTLISEITPKYVEVKVIDAGRGVPESYKELIFERFQQVSATDASEKGGTGLGLPICKAIIEQHGGTIGVESTEGKGSTFWFRIPGN